MRGFPRIKTETRPTHNHRARHARQARSKPRHSTQHPSPDPHPARRTERANGLLSDHGHDHTAYTPSSRAGPQTSCHPARHAASPGRHSLAASGRGDGDGDGEGACRPPAQAWLKQPLPRSHAMAHDPRATRQPCRGCHALAWRPSHAKRGGFTLKRVSKLRVVACARSSRLIPSWARHSPTCRTQAGWLRLPRYGTGAR